MADSLGDRRKRGAALLVGGITMTVLIEVGWLAFYWTPLMVGLTYVAAAVASGGRGSLWAPGLMLVASGMAMAFWLENGRSTDDLEFLGVTVLGLGAGGVLAAFMTRAGYDITAMSVAMTVMAFGGFVLAAQHELPGFTRNIYMYGGLFILWGLVGVVKGTLSRDPRLS